MALYLVQHGKSLPKETDPDQGLSEEGKKEVEKIASIARDQGLKVSCIKHSGKKRARQTAEIFASLLNPKEGVQETGGLNPLDDVTVFAPALNSKDNLMLVGHLPFMERLAAYLIMGSIDKAVCKFQNGGILCLDQDEDGGNWWIKWSLMPKLE